MSSLSNAVNQCAASDHISAISASFYASPRPSSCQRSRRPSSTKLNRARPNILPISQPRSRPLSLFKHRSMQALTKTRRPSCELSRWVGYLRHLRLHSRQLLLLLLISLAATVSTVAIAKSRRQHRVITLPCTSLSPNPTSPTPAPPLQLPQQLRFLELLRCVCSLNTTMERDRVPIHPPRSNRLRAPLRISPRQHH